MADTITRPVDLIVANELHDAAARIERLTAANQIREAALQQIETRRHLSESIARQLLCAIAHQATIDCVLAALAAVGAPATLTELDQRFQAVRDQRRASAAAMPGAQRSGEGQP